MKLLTKIKLLNRLGLFNIFRFLKYKKANCSPKIQNFYRKFLDKGDLCFDVGSNIGEKVDLFLKLNAKVIAIEPQQDCYHFLERFYGHNNNVTPLNIALDEKEGEQTLYVCEANALSTMSQGWIEQSKEVKELSGLSWDKQITVRTETLDNLIREYGAPKLCKIDVEGFEYQVLQGLTQPIPYISFEIADRNFDGAIRCIEYLDSIGEAGFKHTPYERYSFSNQEWDTKDDFIEFIKSLDSSLITGDIYTKFRV